MRGPGGPLGPLLRLGPGGVDDQAQQDGDAEQPTHLGGRAGWSVSVCVFGFVCVGWEGKR